MGTVINNRGTSCVGVCKTGTTLIRVSTVTGTLYKAFDDGIKTRNFEECCYAIYYALKYDFNIRKLDATDMVGINSCLLMLLTYLYYKKHGDVTSIEIMKKHAKSLVAKDLDRNWLFVYEVLEEVDLSDDWKVLKRKEISFLKPEFQY